MMNEPPISGDDCGEDAADSAPEPASIPLNPAIAALLASAVAGVPNAAPGKILSPEAIRALEEAEARRQAAPPAELPLEWDGRGGEEPTRYGDWERRGLATDF